MIKRSFPGLLDLYLWVVLGLGSVSKSMLLVGSLVKGQVHNWMTCCDALFKLFTIILSVYTLFAFIKRKPDAIALAKAQLIIQLALTFVTTVSNLVVDFSTAILVRNVLIMAWNAFLLWYICTSDRVSAYYRLNPNLFSKSYQQFNQPCFRRDIPSYSHMEFLDG